MTDEDEREFCCSLYAIWFLIVNVVKPGTPEMHRPGCLPDAYTEMNEAETQ